MPPLSDKSSAASAGAGGELGVEGMVARGYQPPPLPDAELLRRLNDLAGLLWRREALAAHGKRDQAMDADTLDAEAMTLDALQRRRWEREAAAARAAREKKAKADGEKKW